MAEICGHGLRPHITGSIPPQFLSDGDQVLGTLNPEFLAWQQQDQILLSWLLSSLSEPILNRFVPCNQSRQLWDKIFHHFYSQARVKVRMYRSELWNIKKGSRTMNEYLLYINSIVYSLAFGGNPITMQDQVDFILYGLPKEYNSLVIGIETRAEPYTLAEIETLLLVCEAQLNQRCKHTASDGVSESSEKSAASDLPAPIPSTFGSCRPNDSNACCFGN